MKPFLALFMLLLVYSCSVIREAEGVFATGETFHLASPRCIVDSVLFLHSATLSMELDYPGVEIYYTEDSGAVTLNSHLYRGPIQVDASQTIKARAFHPELLPSEVVSRQFKKVNMATRNAGVDIHPGAHAAYPGNGPLTLIDLQKGSTNFRNSNRWMGFQADTVDIRLSLDGEMAIGSVTLSVLEDNGSWIFLPRRIEVFADGTLVGAGEWPPSASAGPPALKFLEIPITGTTTDNLQVRVAHWANIPDWHPGKGTRPWFFIDELLIN